MWDQVLRVVSPDTDSSRSKGCHLMDDEFTKGGGDLKVKMSFIRLITGNLNGRGSVAAIFKTPPGFTVDKHFFQNIVVGIGIG